MVHRQLHRSQVPFLIQAMGGICHTPTSVTLQEHEATADVPFANASPAPLLAHFSS